MSKAYKLEIDNSFSDDVRFSKFENMMKEHMKNRMVTAKDLINLDAEVNGGALVQIAIVLGKPIYIRVNHRDEEQAKQEILHIRSLIKDMVIGNIGE